MQIGDWIRFRPFLFQFPKVFLPLECRWVGQALPNFSLKCYCHPLAQFVVKGQQYSQNKHYILKPFYTKRWQGNALQWFAKDSEPWLAQYLAHRKHSVLVPSWATQQVLKFPGGLSVLFICYSQCFRQCLACRTHSYIKLILLQVGEHRLQSIHL